MKRFAYIDALRGYAILAVMAVHAGQCVPALKSPWRPLADQGARGVQLFYVASALTLCISWFGRGDGKMPFYIRRLFRIAPMFWLALAFFLALGGFGVRYFAPTGIGWPHVIATFAFVHGFHPETINSIVPGGWTIANEMIFYALFPALMWGIRSWRSAAAAFIASLVFAEWLFPHAIAGLPLVMPGEDRGLLSNFAFLYFPNQFPVFLLGILLFHIMRETPPVPKAVAWAGFIASAIAIVELPFLTVLPLQIHFAYSLTFALATFCLARIAPPIIVSAPVRWLGKVSFSAYLWQFAILEVINKFIQAGHNPLRICDPSLGLPYFLTVYSGLVAFTSALSAFTYRYVEAPMIRLGEGIVGRRSLPRLPAISDTAN